MRLELNSSRELRSMSWELPRFHRFQCSCQGHWIGSNRGCCACVAPLAPGPGEYPTRSPQLSEPSRAPALHPGDVQVRSSTSLVKAPSRVTGSGSPPTPAPGSPEWEPDQSFAVLVRPWIPARSQDGWFHTDTGKTNVFISLTVPIVGP